MSELILTKEETDARHGRYVGRIEGLDSEGEITFTKRRPCVVSADHTGVPEEMAGSGVGTALIRFILEDARREGLRIIPICQFVRSQYARHPEWADLFTTAPGGTPARA